MNDSLIQLLQDVIDTLTSLTDQNGKKIFRKVSLYNNQFQKLGLQNMYDANAKVKVNNVSEVNDWPACFIEPVVDQVDGRGERTQVVQGRLLIHICTYRLDIEKNWQYPYQLRSIVHKALHMLKNTNDAYATLTRSMEQPDVDHDSFYNWISTYSFLITDETSVKSGFSGTAGFSLNISIVE